jgi:hypothetical protein
MHKTTSKYRFKQTKISLAVAKTKAMLRLKWNSYVRIIQKPETKCAQNYSGDVLSELENS